MNRIIRHLRGIADLRAHSPSPVFTPAPWNFFSGSGADATTQFNAFRATVGGARIAWDGVRLDGTDANPATSIIDLNNTVAIPVDRFRGAGAIYAAP